MVIGQELGVRRWNIEGRVVDFKKHLKETQRENQLQIKAKKNAKSFCWSKFSCFNIENEMLQNAGCDRPTPLTRISSPRFVN